MLEATKQCPVLLSLCVTLCEWFQNLPNFAYCLLWNFPHNIYFESQMTSVRDSAAAPTHSCISPERKNWFTKELEKAFCEILRKWMLSGLGKDVAVFLAEVKNTEQMWLDRNFDVKSEQESNQQWWQFTRDKVTEARDDRSLLSIRDISGLGKDVVLFHTDITNRVDKCVCMEFLTFNHNWNIVNNYGGFLRT